MPSFVICTVLMYFLGVKLAILPTIGLDSIKCLSTLFQFYPRIDDLVSDIHKHIHNNHERRLRKNKVAMVSLVVIILVMIFSFIVPMFYPYSLVSDIHKHIHNNHEGS